VNIQENVSLAKHSTMRLGGEARYFAEVTDKNQLQDLVAWAKEKNLRIIMIGEGSNIVWRDEIFDGLLLHSQIKGKEILLQDDDSATVKLAAGENWDATVAWSVDQSLSGIEFLSLIPGLVGAAPVQNIGAYGSDIAKTLVEVEVFDTQSNQITTIPASGCSFSYRSSRFKTTDHGRFLITSITLKLLKQNPQPPFYEALDKYFQTNPADTYTPQIIRQAVIAIRTSKLPDPAKVANNGSFFTNPVIENSKFDKLIANYPEIKGWPTNDGKVKVAAGWLVEQAGFKGVHDQETGMATWPAQALVLVNESAKSTADLLAFKQKIVNKVQELFDITLEQEPELLP
jgi:UDP-N-acetylmuramate dehydrogenase